MSQSTFNDSQIIAPCGIHCGLCYAFLRQKNRCSGCLSPDMQKVKHISTCKIKNCEKLDSTVSGYCYDCSSFPCARLKQLDKRYRIKYHVNLLENLLSIKESGLPTFVKTETLKWRCPNCGGTICMHKGYCLNCKN